MILASVLTAPPVSDSKVPPKEFSGRGIPDVQADEVTEEIGNISVLVK